MSTLITTRRSGFSVWVFALMLNAALLAVAVFMVTQDVRQREGRVNELNRQILSEQQTIRVLDAEWAYLTRPQRIEELVSMKEQQGMAAVAEAPAAKAEEAVKTEKPVEKVAEKAPVAKIEPASGTTQAPKPVAKTAMVTPEKPKADAEKKEVKKVAEVIEKPKPQPQVKKIAQADDLVWSVKRKNTGGVAMLPKRGGIARPIVE
ncbi:MAG: hypothetical protein KGQ41_07100 [Alphaproteobacteria bacterium]|nr:hypothetical protein [Alphaproteobacteria bacterium]